MFWWVTLNVNNFLFTHEKSTGVVPLIINQQPVYNRVKCRVYSGEQWSVCILYFLQRHINDLFYWCVFALILKFWNMSMSNKFLVIQIAHIKKWRLTCNKLSYAHNNIVKSIHSNYIANTQHTTINHIIKPQFLMMHKPDCPPPTLQVWDVQHDIISWHFPAAACHFISHSPLLPCDSCLRFVEMRSAA